MNQIRVIKVKINIIKDLGSRKALSEYFVQMIARTSQKYLLF